MTLRHTPTYLLAALSVISVASAALFNTPKGIAIDSSDNLYVGDSDQGLLRKITPSGVVTTLAGAPGGQPGTLWENCLYDGTGNAARFNGFGMSGVAVDPSGNIFVTDGANTVRRITPASVVTTFAGHRYPSGVSTDGVGASVEFVAPSGIARFDHPTGICADQSGNLYVTSTTEERLRKITPSAVVTTLANFYSAPWSIRGCDGVAADASDNIYVCSFDDHTIVKVTPTGVISVFSGTRNHSCNGSSDNSGNACTLNGATAAALYKSPRGIAIDGAGAFYIADTGNHIIRKISGGNVTTLAGTPNSPGSADGTGAAGRFRSPTGLVADSAGNVFVADTGNHTIRKITPAGVVTTFAGVAGTAGSSD